VLGSGDKHMNMSEDTRSMMMFFLSGLLFGVSIAVVIVAVMG